jgi:hypothetical protein
MNKRTSSQASSASPPALKHQKVELRRCQLSLRGHLKELLPDVLGASVPLDDLLASYADPHETVRFSGTIGDTDVIFRSACNCHLAKHGRCFKPIDCTQFSITIAHIQADGLDHDGGFVHFRGTRQTDSGATEYIFDTGSNDGLHSLGITVHPTKPEENKIRFNEVVKQFKYARLQDDVELLAPPGWAAEVGAHLNGLLQDFIVKPDPVSVGTARLYTRSDRADGGMLSGSRSWARCECFGCEIPQRDAPRFLAPGEECVIQERKAFCARKAALWAAIDKVRAHSRDSTTEGKLRELFLDATVPEAKFDEVAEQWIATTPADDDDDDDLTVNEDEYQPFL